jgi:hypothetical protein
VTKDGRIFDSKEFHTYAAVVFFHHRRSTTLGTDGKPPMSAKGKQNVLDAIRGGMGFVGAHSASDTFHTQPDPPDRSRAVTLRMATKKILICRCSAPNLSCMAANRDCRMRL